MSFLRRRTSSATNAEPAAGALTAPLLARDNDGDDVEADDALAIASTSSPSSLAAILWQALVASPVAAAFSLLLSPLLPEAWRPFTLSATAQRALDALRQDAARPFDPNSPDHEADLRELWAATFDGSAHPYPRGGKSPLWKEAGWQGDDPRTDLRGGGRGALTAALHMRKRQPLLWARLRDKKRDGAAGGEDETPWLAPEGLEYPFGAAGVNVAFMVSQVAGLHSHDASSGAAANAATNAAAAAGSVSEGGKGRGPAPSKGPPRTAAAKGFAALLEASAPEDSGERGEGGPTSSSASATASSANDDDDDDGDDENEDPHAVALRLRAWSVFGDVYCAAFEALDDEWCRRRASYLDFPSVMAATRARLERALASRRAGDAREGLRRELRRQR